MIEDVRISADAAVGGDEIELVAIGTSTMKATVKCFVYEPPPPGYRECPECRTQEVRSGQPFTFRISHDIWRNATGEIQVEVVDGDGDRRTISLRVDEAEMAAGV